MNTSLNNTNVLFITSPPLLDNALELVNRAKSIVGLHVVIYASGSNYNGTVLSFVESFNQIGFFDYHEVRKHLNYTDILDEYFSGCKSIHFAFFPKKISFDYFNTLKSLIQFSKVNNISIVHLDDFSGVIIPFYIFSFLKKTILNVHDPVPHAGEYNRFREFLKCLLIRFSNHLVTFSSFSYNLMNEKYRIKHKSSYLYLLPYRFYSKIKIKKIFDLGFKKDDIVLLFFGRLSKYKGLEELLCAFNKLKHSDKRVKLLIAGKSEDDLYLEKLNFENNDSVIFIQRFIDVEEMCSIFLQSSILVCPYREATQSGVLMTSAAFGIPVLTSDVGSFLEYTHFLGNSRIYDSSVDGNLEKALRHIIDHPIDESNSNFDLYEYDKKIYNIYSN